MKEQESPVQHHGTAGHPHAMFALNMALTEIQQMRAIEARLAGRG